MNKLSIEAVTGRCPENLGLSANTSFLIDVNGVVIGIATSEGSFDYAHPEEFQEVNLTEIIELVNEERGEVE